MHVIIQLPAVWRLARRRPARGHHAVGTLQRVDVHFGGAEAPSPVAVLCGVFVGQRSAKKTLRGWNFICVIRLVLHLPQSKKHEIHPYPACLLPSCLCLRCAGSRRRPMWKERRLGLRQLPSSKERRKEMHEGRRLHHGPLCQAREKGSAQDDLLIRP